MYREPRHVLGSEDNLWEAVLSFQRLSSVMRVGPKAFTPVSEPTCQAYAQPFKDSMRF